MTAISVSAATAYCLKIAKASHKIASDLYTFLLFQRLLFYPGFFLNSREREREKKKTLRQTNDTTPKFGKMNYVFRGAVNCCIKKENMGQPHTDSLRTKLHKV